VGRPSKKFPQFRRATGAWLQGGRWLQGKDPVESRQKTRGFPVFLIIRAIRVIRGYEFDI
jgi:hypothetical protein